MNVSAQSAQTIVEEIGAVIGRQINMMNEKDIIIGSTDKNCVKTFHKAARKIIAEDSDEITVHSTTEYSGAAGNEHRGALSRKICGSHRSYGAEAGRRQIQRDS